MSSMVDLCLLLEIVKMYNKNIKRFGDKHITYTQQSMFFFYYLYIYTYICIYIYIYVWEFSDCNSTGSPVFEKFYILVFEWNYKRESMRWKALQDESFCWDY